MSKIIVGNSDMAKAFQELSGLPILEIWNGEPFDTYFILHEDESNNVKDTIKIYKDYPDSIIHCAIFDEQLGLKIKNTIPNFNYFIPSQLVTDKFITAINDAKPTETKFKKSKFKLKIDPWLKPAFIFVGLIIILSTSFFKFYHHYSLINSLYFTLVQMITGGDTGLMNANSVTKIVACIVMITGFVSIAIIISIVTEFMMIQKQMLTWGIKKYRGKNHVIVVGGGTVGYNVIRELKRIGETPVLIDKSIKGEHIKLIKKLKTPFLIADARDSQVLFDAGLGDAKALIAVTDSDLINFEIGLDTIILDPKLRVVLRIFDHKLVDSLKHTKLIEHCYSMSYTAAEYLKDILNLDLSKNKVYLQNGREFN